MSLKVHHKKKINGITFRSGHMYNFRYVAAQNDFNPDFLFLYAFSGYHPTSKREWRFIQGITISYLPRKTRKKFINDWKKEFSKNTSMSLKWKSLIKKYPYLQDFTRRYFYSPNYYIRSAKEIPLEDWDKQIVRSFAKDFSKTIRRKVAARLKGLFSGKRR